MIIGLSEKATSVTDILRALDHRISPLDNWQAKVVDEITTPGAADTEFTVNHNLGIVPTHYIANVDKNAVIYDSRRVDWTASQMFLKASAATVKLYLIVL